MAVKPDHQSPKAYPELQWHILNAQDRLQHDTWKDYKRSQEVFE